tara:strand:+ start:270 stop:791 length:522 start_codon:yes stop_codon:yes gene_type:complete
MIKLLSAKDLDIYQENFQQVLIRGDGKDQFNELIRKELSIIPPNKNLEVIENERFLFAKNSFDQWSLLYLKEQDYREILNFISVLNKKDEVLASDYSYGQVYFKISGKNRNQFLNKLTQFDLRLKKFPINSMAQTLIARINCSIYNLKDKYLITCNRSFESYFKDRLEDTINL